MIINEKDSLKSIEQSPSREASSIMRYFDYTPNENVIIPDVTAEERTDTGPDQTGI